MVVPYQKPIEKPADSKVFEFDSQMTTILSNPKLTAHEKVSLYHQALAKFQTYFDPKKFQQSPALLDVAGSVKSLVQQQMQIQEKTLANLFDLVAKTEAETKKTQSEIARLNRIMSGEEKFDDPDLRNTMSRVTTTQNRRMMKKKQ
jgi:hypothetical protein